MRGKLSELRKVSQISNTPLPGIPLVEVLGNSRVLIENHYGVTAYGDDLICVKVRCGHIEVNGTNLTLTRMSDSQIIVNGLINGIQFYYSGGGASGIHK